MKRRSLFKAASLAGVSGLFSFLPASANSVSETPPERSYGFRRFMLGDLELTIVSDGNLMMAPVQPIIAPDIAPEKVKALLEESFRPTDHIELGINILVVKKAGKLILVDSGMGANAAEPGENGMTNGVMMANLNAAGFSAGDFTDVVVTHAHPDHIGGLLTKAGAIAFPNAQIHMNKIEFDFWTLANPDLSKARIDPKMAAPIVAGTKKALAALKPKIVFYNSGDKLLNCIETELAAGHTPGHSLIHVYSGNNRLTHVGDLVHSDVLLFPHPEWGFYGDTDFNQAAVTRRKVMAALAASRTRVMVYHLAWPGLGYVRVKGEGFEWVPELFANAEMG